VIQDPLGCVNTWEGEPVTVNPLADVIECEACGERWCLKCSAHWAICSCPGLHDDDVVECVADQAARACFECDHRFEAVPASATVPCPVVGCGGVGEPLA